MRLDFLPIVGERRGSAHSEGNNGMVLSADHLAPSAHSITFGSWRLCRRIARVSREEKAR
eukprot:COSAG04_NODE_16702_length_491_cov_2.471939_1_plen_59_part_01